MAASSRIGKALELIASEAADCGIDWGTDPVAKWYPDFDAETIKPLGLTAFVLPETADYTPPSRGREPTQTLSVFVAVVAPIETGSFAEGDEVVNAAEILQGTFYRRQLTSSTFSIACVETRFEPAMSADFAKQQNNWVAILKMELIAQR